MGRACRRFVALLSALAIVMATLVGAPPQVAAASSRPAAAVAVTGSQTTVADSAGSSTLPRSHGIEADGAPVTEFSTPTNSEPWGIVSGPDGNLWFSENYAGRIGRISTSGSITEFVLPGLANPTGGITVGADGNLWFTAGNQVGRITTTGTATLFPVGGMTAWQIAAGADGNLWFTTRLSDVVGRLTPDGVVTDFSLPSGSWPWGIVSGPRGHLWVAEEGSAILEIDPSTVTFTQHQISQTGLNPTGPRYITAGPDGNLWFSDENNINKIDRMTPSGLVSVFSVPITVGVSPSYRALTTGPDGAIWYTDDSSNYIGRMSMDGTVTEQIPIPNPPTCPGSTCLYEGISAGPDGNIWFTEGRTSKIARVAIALPSSASCAPGSSASTTSIAFGSKVACAFTAGGGATFTGWSATGFTPTASTQTSGSFTATTPGSGQISATYTDGTGSHTISFAYTVRGVAVFLLRGMTTTSDDGFGSLPSTLIADGVPSSSIIYYSYNGPVSSTDPTPKPYSCSDTLNSIGADDIPILDSQLRAYVSGHPNVDIYLAGHSQGGVVALGYLAYLQHKGRSLSDIPSPDGTKHGHLTGVVTLDSPIGGLNGLMSLIAVQATLKCPSVPLSGAVDGVELGLIALTGGGNPWGGTHRLGLALFGDLGVGTNDQLATIAAGTGGGPRILTVGNTDDNLFDPVPVTGNSMTTQWLTNDPSSNVYSRAITASNNISWLDEVLNLRGQNHSLVLSSPSVAADIWSLIMGGVPSATPVSPSVSGGVSPAAPTGSIAGTVTGAGSAGLPNIDVAAISTADLSAVTTTTASGGTYSIPLDPGTYVVAFHDPAGAYPAGYAGASAFTTDLSSASQVSVGSGATTVNVALPGGHAISGTVTANGGAPLAGISVEAQTPAGVFVGGATTDASGAYSLVLPAGSYVVEATDYSDAHAGGYYAGDVLSSTLAGATTVPLGSADVSGIAMVLPSTVHIRGTVSAAGSAGLANILVIATPQPSGDPIYAYTGADGSYSLTTGPGSYKIGFSDPAGLYIAGYYGSGGYTAAAGSAMPVSVGSTDVGGINVQMPAAVPGKPTGVTATAGNGSGVVSWTAPSSNGGSAITGYTVTSSPEGKTCTTSATSCTVSGLTSGQPYTFTVTATNGAGTGPASDPSSSITVNLIGATYHALTPTRILDSRDGYWIGLAGAFSSHVARTFQVSGHGGVPSNATAVTGNLTVTGQTAAGFLYVGPNAMNDPTSSTLNFPTGDDRANAVTVALGAGGTLSVTYAAPTLGPTAQVIFDVTGYFTPDTSGATYHALTPSRVLDSRDGYSIGLAGAFSSHVARTFQVTGRGGVPSNATAMTGNLTVTGQTAAGFLYVGPNAANDPTSSTLNFPTGDDRANAVTVALGSAGTLSVTYAAPTLGQTAQVIFDVTGYFTPDGSGTKYVPLTPARVLDSRDGYWIGLSGAFSSHVARTFAVSGHGGVPGNATAITGNLTVTGQTALGFLYIGPNAMNNPTSSTLNFPMNDDRANAVTVALGAGGTLSPTYAASTTGATAQVIFDVTGYFVP